MVELFGRKRSRSEIDARTGALAQVAGVELLEYADGPERGVRVLDFRTGAGLSFRVAVDRGFDLLAAELSRRADRLALADRAASSRPRVGRGEPRLGLPALVHRSARDLRPRSRARARDLQPGAVHLSGVHARATIRCTAASRRSRRVFSATASAGTATRARSGPRARSPRWRCSARTWCSRGGSRPRSGAPRSRVDDRVENRGFRPTPHMLLYHYNFGYPLLDEGAELLLPSRAIVHAVHGDLHAQGVGHRLQGPPKADFSEQVYEHDVVAGADGMASALLINPALGAGGFGIRLDYDRDGAALPDPVAVPAVGSVRARHRALDQSRARAQVRRGAGRADVPRARRHPALPHAAVGAGRRRGDRRRAPGGRGPARRRPPISARRAGSSRCCEVGA